MLYFFRGRGRVEPRTEDFFPSTLTVPLALTVPVASIALFTNELYPKPNLNLQNPQEKKGKGS